MLVKQHKCGKCKRVNPECGFAPDRNRGKLGLSGYCRECAAALNRARKAKTPTLNTEVARAQFDWLTDRAVSLGISKRELLSRIIGWAQKDVEERTK